LKIIVIGSGVIGLTTAYLLKERGHDVAVIERELGPSLQTSFANGALLTPSMPEPWNTPGCWRVLFGSIGRSDAPLQLRLSALPSLLHWGVTFLRNSRRTAFELNTISNVRLALQSLKVMGSLREDTHIHYGATARGTLKLFRTSEALDQALSVAERLLRLEGLPYRSLSPVETVGLEPALGAIAHELSGAIYFTVDETGDAYQFSCALAEQSRAQGVEFHFGTNVTSLELESGRVGAVRTEQARLTADQYVIAAGSYSSRLMRTIGLDLPVRPAKGYSVTFDLPDAKNRLKIPIVDDDMHAAVVPVGEKAIRIAGMAEFAGYDHTLRPERVRSVAALGRRLLPDEGVDWLRGKAWCGLRAMSADGVPLIGRTQLTNLWVNTGHGHLGWTMAAGSAELLTHLLTGESPAVGAAPYDPLRFVR
jgi:D-amino-acid dehydrogenase